MTSIDRLVAGIAVEATTMEEKSRFTIRRYDATTHSRVLDLFGWEETWFVRRLPPPPARILVCACGAGREIVWLLNAGYSVDAFEPAATMLKQAEERLRGRANIALFRYEDLIDAVLERSPGVASSIACTRYDAVILGWESLSHVFGPKMQGDLMRAVDRLCPEGPVLASFWLRFEETTGRTAERFGRWIGRAISRLRGSGSADALHVVFTAHAGFGYAFTPDEIDELVRSIGRFVLREREDDTFPHVTFSKSPPARC